MLALGVAAHSAPAPNAQQLALPPIPPASREGQAASADVFETSVETIVNEAKEVIARNKKQAKTLKAMKKEKAPMNAMKKKKHKTDDEVEDDEEDEEEYEEEELEDEHEVEYEDADEDEEDAGDDIKKKPASGMKRPAAAVAKNLLAIDPNPFSTSLCIGGVVSTTVSPKGLGVSTGAPVTRSRRPSK